MFYDFLCRIGLLEKKTVKTVQATFSTMIADLAAIENLESARSDAARKEVARADAERGAAAAFRFGLGKLLAGE